MTGHSSAWAPGRVRIDDLRRRLGWEFDLPRATQFANSTDEVEEVLAAAEAAARGGDWVVCAVGYEASAAFDPAIADALAGVGGRAALPLVWWTSFGRRREVEVVTPPTDAVQLHGLHRLHGPDWYRSGVTAIRDRIAAGDVYQVNLADRVHGDFDGEVFDLYRAMAVAQGGEFNALLEIGDTVVVSASPELFLGVESDHVVTRPMKGTRRRRARPVDDREAASDLVTSDKDRAENVMVVDLLRNDLSRISLPGGVSVPSLFDLERYATVWQLTSTVRAELRDDVDLVALFSAAFPCGSVTGAPKFSAMRTIAEMEQQPRGMYCGSIGVIEPREDEAMSPGSVMRPRSTWSVAIRTAVVDRPTGRVEFGAGGGITIDSDPEAEEDELRSKTEVLTATRPAFSLFETMRLDEEGVHHLDLHLARLAISADHLGFPFDVDEARCAVDAASRVARRSHCLHRLRLTLDDGGSTRVEVVAVETTRSEGPVRLAVSSERIRSDDLFCAHKTTNRAHYDRARSCRPDVDDVVLVNERGEVVETTIASLLYRSGGRWFTPPLSAGGLPGIGRQVLLASGLVSERSLSVGDLASCEGIEVVSALRGRRPAILVV